MSSLTISSVEVFACKTDAPQITWAKDMTPMYEANVIVKLTTEDDTRGMGVFWCQQNIVMIIAYQRL